MERNFFANILLSGNDYNFYLVIFSVLVMMHLVLPYLVPFDAFTCNVSSGFIEYFKIYTILLTFTLHLSVRQTNSCPH